jgi:hypothetical protein
MLVPLTSGILSCAQPEQVEAAAPSPFVSLDATRLARRVSIDLRGRLPTLDELTEGEAEGGLDALVARWMGEPAFEEHLAVALAERWMLHLDELRVDPSEFGLDDDEDLYPLTRAVGDEAPRLIARIVASDRPWSEIVTADFTMANATLADIVQIEWIEADEGQVWREARYTDGRPAGGVLMSSGLWLRHHTTLFNYNRGRAAAIGRLLLCYDYLARPVAFTALADNSTEGINEAVATDTSCQACHATLDPLASTLFGFYPFEDKDGTELMVYHPERERFGETYFGAAPGYFGTDVEAAAQLGQLVASDPRFGICAARQAAEQFWGRSTDNDDLLVLGGLRDVLADSGEDYKAMLRAVIATEEYRAGALTTAATEEQLDRYRTVRLMSPNTLAAVVEELTGFRWDVDGWDELDSDHTGYRALLGGADGDVVRRTNLYPAAPRTLAIRRLAQLAAAQAVNADLSRAQAERRLFGTTAADPLVLEPGSAAFAAEVGVLQTRLLATEPSDSQIAALEELYSSVLEAEGAQAAWTSIVTVLLRDPDFWSY